MVLKKLRTPLIFTAGTLFTATALVLGVNAALYDQVPLDTVTSIAGACLIASAIAWTLAYVCRARTLKLVFGMVLAGVALTIVVGVTVFFWVFDHMRCFGCAG